MSTKENPDRKKNYMSVCFVIERIAKKTRKFLFLPLLVYHTFWQKLLGLFWWKFIWAFEFWWQNYKKTDKNSSSLIFSPVSHCWVYRRLKITPKVYDVIKYPRIIFKNKFFDILRSKGLTLKLDQLIKWYIRKIFIEK